MTFSAPEALAVRLSERVASRDRSQFVSESLELRPEKRGAAMVRACEIANADQEVAEVERDFDGIGDGIAAGSERSRKNGYRVD
jgi:hypothetical protein